MHSRKAHVGVGCQPGFSTVSAVKLGLRPLRVVFTLLVRGHESLLIWASSMVRLAAGRYYFSQYLRLIRKFISH
jgi:hypothetical protein